MSNSYYWHNVFNPLWAISRFATMISTPCYNVDSFNILFNMFSKLSAAFLIYVVKGWISLTHWCTSLTNFHKESFISDYITYYLGKYSDMHNMFLGRTKLQYVWHCTSLLNKDIWCFNIRQVLKFLTGEKNVFMTIYCLYVSQYVSNSFLNNTIRWPICIFHSTCFLLGKSKMFV